MMMMSSKKALSAINAFKREEENLLVWVRAEMARLKRQKPVSPTKQTEAGIFGAMRRNF